MEQLPLGITTDREATFENFYTAEQNQQTLSHLKQFLSGSEQLIYLWGESSSGVTHLLSAIQHLSSHDQGVQYLPMKDLLTYPPEAITETLETLDLICIDDIEVVAGNRAWETALFHLYNRVMLNQKKILVGSHYSPRQLPLQIADLQSRLQYGLVFKIEALSGDQKIKAMQMRANRLGLNLSEEVANYLILRLHRSASTLFAALNRLDSASLAEQRKLTIPFAKKVLEL